jgi:hypothetical protein
MQCGSRKNTTIYTSRTTLTLGTLSTLAVPETVASQLASTNALRPSRVKLASSSKTILGLQNARILSCPRGRHF